MIKREIQNKIKADFNSHKAIVLIGARQVGKTTLVEAVAKGSGKVLSLNCDNLDDRMSLEGKTSTELRDLLKGYDLVFIDEAQRVANIGLTIKMIVDLKMDIPQVIVTGSSSLELAEGIYEPATGRCVNYELYPLSVGELVEHTSAREEQRMLRQRLVYGFYPEVVTNPADAKRRLMSLADAYLYKDLLMYKGVKKPEILQKLLQALALQVGSEVSYNELSNLLGIDKQTVESYIGLLEKCYVIFRLDSYSRNIRNELKKGKKVYFWDNGIRNAVIANFSNPDVRMDMGMLWENFVISERRKLHSYMGDYTKQYFWRTHTQSEINLIEECDGTLAAFEMKWNGKAKTRLPSSFAAAYPDTPFQVIMPNNYMDYV